MEYDNYSLSGVKKKVIGGLLNFKVGGVLHHTNTIEEFNSNHGLLELIEEEQKRLMDTEVSEGINRIIIYTFGDLKNYQYHYRYAFIELETDIVLSKSNKLK